MYMYVYIYTYIYIYKYTYVWFCRCDSSLQATFVALCVSSLFVSVLTNIMADVARRTRKMTQMLDSVTWRSKIEGVFATVSWKVITEASTKSVLLLQLYHPILLEINQGQKVLRHLRCVNDACDEDQKLGSPIQLFWSRPQLEEIAPQGVLNRGKLVEREHFRETLQDRFGLWQAGLWFWSKHK